jgi:PAP_fibrillin
MCNGLTADPLLLPLQGKRRTKLGLRNFISLGNFVQTIDVVSCRASNRVNFNLSGLSFLSGVLQIDASYRVAGPKRVAIDFEKACLVS